MLIAGSKGLTRLAGLLLLLLLHGVAGCATTESEEFDEVNGETPSFPCSPGYWVEPMPFTLLEWTADGRHVLFDKWGNFYRKPVIWKVDVNGTQLRKLVDPVGASHGFLYGFHGDVSPDGKRFVYTSCEFERDDVDEFEYMEGARHNYEVVVINLDGTGKKRLTANDYIDHYPVWSPDGTRIAFIAKPSGGKIHPNEGDLGLYTMASDGSDVQRVSPQALVVAVGPAAWSPDGMRLTYWAREWDYRPQPYSLLATTADGSDVRLLAAPSALAEARHGRVDGDRSERRQLALNSYVYPGLPIWSPDGKRLAFLVVDKEAGRAGSYRNLLFTVREDGTELTWLAEYAVSNPSWSPDGQNIALARHIGNEVALVMLAADGTDERVFTTIATDRIDFQDWYEGWLPTVSWSGDGSRVLYSCRAGACVVNVKTGRVLELQEIEAGTRDQVISAAWSPDGSRIAIFRPGSYKVPLHLYTIAQDGTDRRDLVGVDADGNLAPTNPPQDET